MRSFKRIFICFAVILFITFCSCKSTSYDYEESEEEYVEIPLSKKDSNNTETNKNESASYTVQIGAFSNEQNATDYLKIAKSKLPYDITMKNTNGLYKLQIGNYTKSDDAYKILDKVKELGYGDSFVVKIVKRSNEK